MVDIKTEIEISAPLAKVADYTSDPRNASEWFDNIKSTEWRTNGPLRKGSQIAFKADFMGEMMEYLYEVVYFSPHKKLVMRTSHNPFPMITTYTWKLARDGTTKMTLSNKGTPSGFPKVFISVIALMMKRANRKDLKRVKAILERD